MLYFGHIKNGKVELEQNGQLPEGTRVRVEPLAAGDADPFDRLGENPVDTGLSDMAAEHDHYAYGTPKRGSAGGQK
jgi:hypothetical protein